MGLNTQRGGAPISSQMSEAELAVEDRINTALTSPRFTADAMTPSSVSYSIVREELKERSALNESLSQEQELAFSVTARRDMHNASIKNDEDAKQARRAIIEIGNMVDNKGVTFQEAASDLGLKDPSLALNSTYIKTLKPFSAMVEDRHEKFMRENSQSILETKILTEGFDADLEYAVGSLRVKDMPALLEATQKLNEAGKIQADTALIEANTKNFQAAANFGATKHSMAGLYQANAKAGIPFMTTPEDHGRWESFFHKSGVPIQDVSVFLSQENPTPNQSGFLTNPEMIAKIADSNDLTPKEVLSAISKLGDKDLHDQADGGNQMAKDSISLGRRLIKSGGSMFGYENRNRIKSLEIRKLLKEDNSKLAEGFSKTTAAIRKVIAAGNAIDVNDEGKFSEADLEFKGKQKLEAKNIASAFLRARAIELVIPVSGDLEDEEMIAMLKKSGDTGLPLMSREEMATRGGELGLWVDNSNPPEIKDLNGIKDPQDYEYELTSWLFTRLKSSNARVNSTFSSGDFQDAPVTPMKKEPTKDNPSQVPTKPTGVAESVSSELDEFFGNKKL